MHLASTFETLLTRHWKEKLRSTDEDEPRDVQSVCSSQDCHDGCEGCVKSPRKPSTEQRQRQTCGSCGCHSVDGLMSSNHT